MEATTHIPLNAGMVEPASSVGRHGVTHKGALIQLWAVAALICGCLQGSLDNFV